MASFLGQSQQGGLFHSDAGVVYAIVNLIVGCILFISSKNACSSKMDPTNIKNKSSKKTFYEGDGSFSIPPFFQRH